MSFDGPDTPPPCLGVTASLTGRMWHGLDPAVDRQAAALLQQTGLADLLCRVLATRGVNAETAETYLTPTLRDLMPDPSSVKDMDRAVEVVARAVRDRQRIAIFADYDVDGGASAALLTDWLGQMGLAATLYIPDRIDEGYGPNVPAMEALAQAHDLILCVDCGTLSHAPIAAAREKGAEVVVLDHHQGGETLPDAAAVVNPNRQDEDGELGYLCAAGVVFMLLVALNRSLRAERAVPDLMSLLDLVALATVADVAPLVGLNRALVRQGLAVMACRGRPGLAALADVAKVTSAPAAYHLGYIFGPRVNAGGRIGAADLGARLLATRDPHDAAALAERLDVLNRERRAIEAEVLAQAMEQAEARGTEAPLVWAAGEGWHPGVVGIVASRLKDATNRPALVIGLGNGEGKGSGRSVSGVDLGAAVAACTREGVLLKGGGHAMAAGLTVAEDQLEPAMARLAELLERQGAAVAGASALGIDALAEPAALTPELIEEVERAGPFGAGSSAPRIALPAVRIGFAKRAGESHLRLRLNGAKGGVDAIAFRAFESPLGPALEAHAGRPIHVAGRLEIDDWGGRRQAKLRLEDAAFPE